VRAPRTGFPGPGRDKDPAIMGGHPADRVTPCSVRILGSWKAGGGPSHSAASRVGLILIGMAGEVHTRVVSQRGQDRGLG
jgi:hypothetical protein